MLLLGVFEASVLECSGLRWYSAAINPFISVVRGLGLYKLPFSIEVLTSF